ncbi:uncharacterized protein LOC131883517 [Tigriopus californicus]|uniref:uncharacterized protein LOC131883517 n=1 Tax=Tigriopus californicus TaxID=6832 RepID=UPI0027D9F9F1|nr:uncharacterized protein LOC131883517 [Tigriopus californicus]
MLLRFTLSLVFILFNAFFVKATPNNQTSREKRFSLSSGGTSSENNTYLRESSGTAPGSSYTICKSASDICRIRLDLTTFSISGPATEGEGAIGNCVTDQFSITAPGSRGSPIICGFNTGQHLIVDASDQCHVASFSLGTTPLVTRSWDIKVTQFTCSQEVGGPAGCLQFFMGVSGTISNFNFPASMTVSAETTHLSNQHYKLCIRRESGYCSICYAPFSTGSEPDDEVNFYGRWNF